MSVMYVDGHLVLRFQACYWNDIDAVVAPIGIARRYDYRKKGRRAHDIVIHLACDLLEALDTILDQSLAKLDLNGAPASLIRLPGYFCEDCNISIEKIALI